nr:immunoglobulin heavy chain junction region [Macaca mulatta]MOW22582.1 immunoglobulin heavy chain junction region [Macaca mulatta]MOW22586.1 immunoglobulin heavy chain junction region [Macaca mulatta]MOW22588.1 immunoglobulin heavy chain junction region [Macaca mulatta]MOW22592.1 immunoglobulin heavy chain junction region [Macaca mulatta]
CAKIAAARSGYYQGLDSW